MARRKTINRTGLQRLEGLPAHDAWVNFVCLNCSFSNCVAIGKELLHPSMAFDSLQWECQTCGFAHSRYADLPFKNWPAALRDHRSIQAERFWLGFFRTATEHAESYWKQCNACGRVQPFHAFSKHIGWGPLERQIECRSCKGAINAVLNPKRTAQQLHEASARRRVADLLLEGENEKLSIENLFKRFGAKCFKTKRPLRIQDRGAWAIDHILPSKYLYPLTATNAALLSTEANNAKRDRWPSLFYTNNELIELSRITGADLSVLASRAAIVNAHVDVNACVSRFLKVREHSDLGKRIAQLKKLISDLKLADKLSQRNRRLLGFKENSHKSY